MLFVFGKFRGPKTATFDDVPRSFPQGSDKGAGEEGKTSI